MANFEFLVPRVRLVLLLDGPEFDLGQSGGRFCKCFGAEGALRRDG